jgi:hypothetical protein
LRANSAVFAEASDIRYTSAAPATTQRKIRGFMEVIVQRCQSESSVQSREEIAFNWNGFGSWAVSRRMRTAA